MKYGIIIAIALFSATFANAETTEIPIINTSLDSHPFISTGQIELSIDLPEMEADVAKLVMMVRVGEQAVMEVAEVSGEDVHIFSYRKLDSGDNLLKLNLSHLYSKAKAANQGAINIQLTTRNETTTTPMEFKLLPEATNHLRLDVFKGFDPAKMFNKSRLALQGDAEVKAPAKKASVKAYPNPFNPVVKIALYMPETQQASVEIYDLHGRRLKTLYNDVMTAGERTLKWDGRDDGGRQAASGVYFYRFESPSFSKTGKIALLK